MLSPGKMHDCARGAPVARLSTDKRGRTKLHLATTGHELRAASQEVSNDLL